MRKLVLIALSVAALVAAVAPAANAATRPVRVSKLSLTAQITSFHATAAGVVANGSLNGTLSSGKGTTRKSAPVRFAVLAKASGGRCNVLSLHLAPVYLALLGLQVQTSTINLNLYAERGEVLGNLFCALSKAKVSFGKAAMILNSRLHGRPLQVLAATDALPRAAATAPAAPAACQVLKLVLGPLNLNLLGLVVDLYGQTTSSPVVVTINAVPSQGLLGQVLCGLAGGTGINSLSGLQGLLSNLGLNLSDTQVQNLLSKLGITTLTSGLSQADINRILQSLGLGSSTPSS